MQLEQHQQIPVRIVECFELRDLLQRKMRVQSPPACPDRDRSTSRTSPADTRRNLRRQVLRCRSRRTSVGRRVISVISSPLIDTSSRLPLGCASIYCVNCVAAVHPCVFRMRRIANRLRSMYMLPPRTRRHPESAAYPHCAHPTRPAAQQRLRAQHHHKKTEKCRHGKVAWLRMVLHRHKQHISRDSPQRTRQTADRATNPCPTRFATQSPRPAPRAASRIKL